MCERQGPQSNPEIYSTLFKRRADNGTVYGGDSNADKSYVFDAGSMNKTYKIQFFAVIGGEASNSIALERLVEVTPSKRAQRIEILYGTPPKLVDQRMEAEVGSTVPNVKFRCKDGFDEEMNLGAILSEFPLVQVVPSWSKDPITAEKFQAGQLPDIPGVPEGHGHMNDKFVRMDIPVEDDVEPKPLKPSLAVTFSVVGIVGPPVKLSSSILDAGIQYGTPVPVRSGIELWFCDKYGNKTERAAELIRRNERPSLTADSCDCAGMVVIERSPDTVLIHGFVLVGAVGLRKCQVKWDGLVHDVTVEVGPGKPHQLRADPALVDKELWGYRGAELNVPELRFQVCDEAGNACTTTKNLKVKLTCTGELPGSSALPVCL